MNNIISFHAQGSPESLAIRLSQKSIPYSSLKKFYIKVISVGFYAQTKLGHKVSDTDLVRVHELGEPKRKKPRVTSPFFDINSLLILCSSAVVATYKTDIEEVVLPSPLAQVHFVLGQDETHYFAKVDSPWLLLNNISDGKIKFFYKHNLEDKDALMLLTDIELSVHFLIGQDGGSK